MLEMVSYIEAPQSNLSIPQIPRWLQYFSREAAVESVFAHVAGLPSSSTEEHHTYTVYKAGLKDFLSWVGDEMPTLTVMNRYIAYLLLERELQPSTINSKYLAACRHYLRFLGSQVNFDLRGDDNWFMHNCKSQIKDAADVPSPKERKTTDVPALWRAKFIRLVPTEVNALLRHIDKSSLAGLRDYALMQMAFSTAMRLAEIQRITLDNISMTDDRSKFILTVRGKRGNESPVTLPIYVYAYLMEYVNAYNAGLDDDDPRRIRGDVPVWQPLHSRNHYMSMGRHDPCEGMSHQAIRDVIGNTSEAALGPDRRLAPHDCRRTAAAIAFDAGMPLPDIQKLLRHKNAAQTLEYIGVKPDYHKRDLSTYITFG